MTASAPQRIAMLERMQLQQKKSWLRRVMTVMLCIMVAGLGAVVADTLSDAQHRINLG
jgi:hypothetical protein